MARRDFERLINPRSIALVGATAWTDAVAAGNRSIGFSGELWRVHPSRPSTAAVTYYRSIAELPAVPDAAFIAVPNYEAAVVAAALAARGAGGFVCFSAGFSELGTERGTALSQDLQSSAGALPYFGPNCYGYVNFFDRVAMMPDQIVGTSPTRGVALICQSGTLALTLMFNDRSLPIGYVFTIGNQTRLAVEDLIEALSADDRVTAFGLYLEGVQDMQRFARAVTLAQARGKPIALIKSGRSAAAARTAHSHTGSLTGADAVFEAFCGQAGIARCNTLGALCETLKILHLGGPLRGRKVLIMGASGGDMAMTADVANSMALEFTPLPAHAQSTLSQLLTDRVTVANPLDIHTYLWFDPPALKKVFSQVLNAGYDAAGFMLDCPPAQIADTASFDAVIDVFIEASQGTLTRAALIASLPETMSAAVRERCLSGNVIPLQGQREALEALALTGAMNAAHDKPLLQIPQAGHVSPAFSLSEADGKVALAAHGLSTPRGVTVTIAEVADAADSLGYPVVIKACAAHLEHKTEVGGVVLDVRSRGKAVEAAARLASLSETVLVEEMITDGVAEVLIGVTLDQQFGQVLVVASGGIYAELMADAVTLLPPWSRVGIETALSRLKAATLLKGHRGRPAGDLPALVTAVMSVAAYATENLQTVVEIDVNPVIVRPLGCGVVAVDALIRLKQSNL